MNRFGGRFASGMKRELAVGDSPARFGSSGLGDSPAQFECGSGRFTTRPHLCLFVLLAQSPSHIHSRSLTVSLSLSLSRLLTVSLSHSLAVWVTQLGRSMAVSKVPSHTTPASLSCWSLVSPPQTSPKARAGCPN
jgi:hypothetical protein